MNLITYANKVALNKNPDVPEINKVTADNMNEIKNVINNAINEINKSISNLSGKILWTNSNPDIAINENTDITLSSSDYDMLEIYYKLAIDNNKVQSFKIPKGYDFTLDSIGYQGLALRRFVNRNSDTSYTIASYSGENVANSGNYIIPIYIVGYKTNLFN